MHHDRIFPARIGIFSIREDSAGYIALIQITAAIPQKKQYRRLILPPRLNGILLFATVPCLGVAAVYAKKLFEKTNNVWLAAFVNTMAVPLAFLVGVHLADVKKYMLNL